MKPLLANLEMRDILGKVEQDPKAWQEACRRCWAMRQEGRIPFWEAEAKGFWSYVLGQAWLDKNAEGIEAGIREIRERFPGSEEAEELIADYEARLRKIRKEARP